MSKTRNTKSGRYAKTEEANTNPAGTVVESGRRAGQLRRLRHFAASLTFDTLENQNYADGVNKALSFFDEK